MATHTAKAEDVKLASEIMSRLGVTIYDLELWGHVSSSESELKVTPEEAYDALVAKGFDLVGDSHAISHYYQATADHVSDALKPYSNPDHAYEEFHDEDDLWNHLDADHNLQPGLTFDEDEESMRLAHREAHGEA